MDTRKDKRNKTTDIERSWTEAIYSTHDVIDIINVVVVGPQEIQIKSRGGDVVPILGRDIRGTCMKRSGSAWGWQQRHYFTVWCLATFIQSRSWDQYFSVPHVFRSEPIGTTQNWSDSEQTPNFRSESKWFQAVPIGFQVEIECLESDQFRVVAIGILD